jgi:hypothetical protein
MKHLFKPALLALLLGSLIGCDKIEEGKYREIRTDTDTSEVDTTGVFSAERKVLLEDYTGFTCPNCPEATEKAEELSLIYGSKLVVMGIHAGHFAEPEDAPSIYTYDFRTSTGTQLDEFFNISNNFGNPNGMINRVDYPTENVKSVGKWAAVVDAQTKLPQEAALKIGNFFNPSTRKLTVYVEAKFLTSLSSQYNLTVHVTEDSIVKPQVSRTQGNIENYMHRHVLRATLSPAFGDQLPDSAYEVGDRFSKIYSFVLPAEWKEKHCHVIAVLSERDTYKILQAEEIKALD